MSSSKYPEFSPTSLDVWTKAASKHAPAGDVGNLNWITPEGLTVKPLYTAADTAGLKFADIHIQVIFSQQGRPTLFDQFAHRVTV